MNVFVTGATGVVGSAVVAELIDAGHRITGLARNEAAAAKLVSMGALAHRGDLHDHDALRAGAAAADGVIHMAFIHDFSNLAASIEVDRRAVRVLADAVRPGAAFINTHGTALLAGANLATEDQTPDPNSPLAFRLPSEQIGLGSASRGVRSSVIRLSPTVHGAGDHGFVPMLIDLARRKGFAAFIGDGANRWPAVHRRDAARLYRLALENAAPGARLHAVAEEGVTMRQIAQTIGQGLGLPARSLGKEEAAAHFGWMAGFAAMDNPTSSAITRQTMRWTPREPGLLIDMRDNGYFA